MSLSTSSVQVKQSPAENTVPPGVGRVSTRRSHSAAAVRKRALAGCVGAAELEALVAVCAEAGVDAARIRARSVTTGHAIIQVDANGQNCIIVEPGANGTVGTDDIAAFLDGYGTGDVLLTQNEISHMPDVLRAAHEKGLTVALNPSPFSAEILSWPLECVDIFIVNEIEGGALSGESVPGKGPRCAAPPVSWRRDRPDARTRRSNVRRPNGEFLRPRTPRDRGGHDRRGRYVHRVFSRHAAARRHAEGLHGDRSKSCGDCRNTSRAPFRRSRDSKRRSGNKPAKPQTRFPRMQKTEVLHPGDLLLLFSFAGSARHRIIPYTAARGWR